MFLSVFIAIQRFDEHTAIGIHPQRKLHSVGHAPQLSRSHGQCLLSPICSFHVWHSFSVCMICPKIDIIGVAAILNAPYASIVYMS